MGIHGCWRARACPQRRLLHVGPGGLRFQRQRTGCFGPASRRCRVLHLNVGIRAWPSPLGFVVLSRANGFSSQRPFGPYYGIQYSLVELSTPFVNIHWFLNKMGLAGSKLQVVNGIVLMITFACCRLLWGSYMTFTFFGDVWTAIHAEKPSFTLYDYSSSELPLALEHHAPGWVAVAFMFTHTVVMSLSIFWFSKMVATMRKHVKVQGDEKEKKVE